METTLCNINKYINIDVNRERYSGYFTGIRDQLFTLLKKDEAFCRLFNGFQLGGSYGDNVRVNTPDEFDLVFFLRLPESSRIIVTRDTRIPGNVFIDLTKVLKTIEKQQQHKILNVLLRGFIDSKNMLIVEKLQNWLCSCVQRAINQLGTKVNVNGEILEIKFTRCGPAHTFKISGPVTFSIDFVPAIKLDAQQSVLSPQLRNNCPWEAIPKPLKPPQPDSCSFRGSYYTAEYELLRNKNNLKNALRFMKKFRDRNQNMSNLKSYYIKTLFLWKLKEVNPDYWRSQLTVIIIDMFDALEKALTQRKLKFYWDPELNMFQGLNKDQLTEMLNRVITARVTLVRARDNFTERLQYDVRLLFMSRNERDGEGIRNPNAPITTVCAKEIQDTKPQKNKNNCCIA